VHTTSSFGSTALHVPPEDPELARALINLLLAHGTDATQRNSGDKTAAERLEAEDNDEIVVLLEAALLGASSRHVPVPLIVITRTAHRDHLRRSDRSEATLGFCGLLGQVALLLAA
jgi:hypothetical protein